MKRYQFLEGLSCYWSGVTIMEETRVKKIAKPYTPFSYRKSAVDAFDRLFRMYRNSIIVLSYSSNGYPDWQCDLAIPNKGAPRILIEAKGYGATGSKMTDVLGDIEKIIAAKRADTALLFFTDGLTWKQRKSDLKKIADLQNDGEITRIYNDAMAAQSEADLRQLKGEYNL